MPSAQQCTIVGAGLPPIFPMLAVVDITPTRWPVATGEHATAIAMGDRPADPARPVALVATDVEDLAIRTDDDPVHGGVAPGHEKVRDVLEADADGDPASVWHRVGAPVLAG